ncbi:macrolide export ATP-binding/permease protein MacB [Desulfosporosinus acididurans]|uniref:Macrolide export ATP-binding/permease protein MacB n=1 Tax=Desulfosporosinus acididurans TaxID=476652 RepID=A0A0J1FM25_9FIRM|nr:ABC transporter ATP-binding protein [Desulfosporosinus acididurans]KLU64529.1 macrolide export ATP-binding/permease protein MacB [Desulfosporosinus acididurans]
MTFNDFMMILDSKPLDEVLKEYPIGWDFLANFRLNNLAKELPFSQALLKVDDEALAEFGLDRFEALKTFGVFLEQFTPKENLLEEVKSITISGGWDKSRTPENISLTISAGEIISIVGPTGSGKSRLLNDIECLAQGDTLTGRRILVNGAELDELQRFEMEGKLVAQLSQNMNFVMDLTVREFLEMHARCRLTPNIGEVVAICFQRANQLAGEKFSEDTLVTQLSGGQSRALMIADTAYMSDSPIILIDEIENAGINRRQAIGLLAKREKIIFVSTHDPLLALSAHKRIIIKNGGIAKVIGISEEEKKSLGMIENLDNTMQRLRTALRAGELIHMKDLNGPSF